MKLLTSSYDMIRKLYYLKQRGKNTLSCCHKSHIIHRVRCALIKLTILGHNIEDDIITVKDGT